MEHFPSNIHSGLVNTWMKSNLNNNYFLVFHIKNCKNLIVVFKFSSSVVRIIVSIYALPQNKKLKYIK